MKADITRDCDYVRASIDDCLSGVDQLPSLRVDIVRKARGEIKVKKKLSVGLALMIILTLLVAGAVAAVILSIRQIVEEKAIPMANQYEGELYTAEDTDAILQLAEENGIELSQPVKAQIQKALDQGEGYFKEEMLMALAKAEFGENPAAWTLEQQKWFDDVCIAVGLISEPEKAMPTGGEDAKLSIVQAATDYIHQTYATDAPLDDPSKYEIGVQYINGLYNDYKGLYWAVDYLPLYLEGAEYWVYLREDGSLLGDAVFSGLNNASTVFDILDAYTRIFSMADTWSQSTLRSFRDAAIQSADTNSRAYLCLAQTKYPDIPENAISREQAHSIAAKYVGYDEQLSRSQMFFIGDKPNPVWKVRIILDADQWSLEIDCITGEVKSALLLDDLHSGWWMQMVLWTVSDEIDGN